jgi:group I intron endonuclease
MGTIYAIKCLSSTKTYVGSTTNFQNRKSRHLNDLNKGNHHSKKLQRSWNKYGINNFIFIILEEDVKNLSKTICNSIIFEISN